MSSSAFFVRALYDFNSETHSSLSFRKNDKIQVLTQLESGWWDGLCNGHRGWFPSNYVTTENDEDIDDIEVEVTKECHDVADDKEGLDLDLEGDKLSDWMVQHTPDGVMFYYNVHTASTTSNHHRASRSLDSLSGSIDILASQNRPLPENWIQHPTEDGTTYYYLNIQTQEIRWTHPSGSIITTSNDIDGDGIVSHVTSIEEEVVANDDLDAADEESLASSRGSRLSTSTIGTIQQRQQLNNNNDDSKLPPNWSKRTTPQGKDYYYNQTNEETIWSLENVDSGAPGYSDQSIYSPEPLIIMTNELLNWDSLLSSIILSIQQLHNAAKENAKHDFIVCTNSIVERIRIMLYASGTIDKESYTIRENKNLKLFHRRIMASLSKLVLSTKIAAGVWPPPDSNQKLRNDVDEVLEAVQQFVQISKNIVEIRRVDPRILQSSYGGSWRGNNLRPMLTNNRHRRNPSLLLKYKSGSDSNGFAAPSQHLTDGLVISIDQNSKFIFKTINSLMSDINSIRDASLNNNASSKNINDMAQLFNQVHQIIKQSGQFLSMLEDIDLKDLDEYSQSFINEFEVAKQFIYNSIASLIIVIQASIDPLNQRDVLEELINSANIVEKSVKDVIIALKFLLEEKESRLLPHPISASSDYSYDLSPPLSPIDSTANDKLVRKQNKVSKFFGVEVLPELNEKPWFLEYDYDHSDIVFNMETQVKGGTLKALIERLTSHDQLDSNFIATFLLTYRSFCTTDEFFRHLVDRFVIQPPERLSSEELKIWQEKKQKPVRLRVYNIMKTWLETYYIDGDDSHCLEDMREFTNTIVKEHMSFATNNLIKAINRRQQQPKQAKFRDLVLTMSTQPPPPIVPRNFKKVKFLDLEPLEIARQLTIIESKLYNKIRPVECLNKAWSKEEASTIAITGWVAESILNISELRGRCALIKHFILIADKCRSLNNFNSLTAIISGLNSAPVHRLRRTWELVHQKTLLLLESLVSLMNPSKSFAVYREQLHSINPPCVPFLGVYLTDLTFVEDGNPNTLKNSNKLINFSKRMKTADIIREIQQYQSVPYNLQPVPEIQEFIKKNLEDSKDIRDLYDL
ncbi:10207_t:CDS:2, partial [Entrophospora sp. SA101]